MAKKSPASVLVRLDPETVRLLTDAAEEAGRSRNNFLVFWLGKLAEVHAEGSLEELLIDLQQARAEGSSPFDPAKMQSRMRRRKEGE